MTDKHSITPPPDRLHNWCQELKINGDRVDLLLIKAAQWGADQELEACCAFAQNQAWGLVNGPHVADVIRAARRPKPPSLKQQALKSLTSFESTGEFFYDQMKDLDTIRRALETLSDD